MAERIRTQQLPVSMSPAQSMPEMVVTRTDEVILRVTLSRPDPSRLFEARVQRYWNQWIQRRRLVGLIWLGVTVATLASAIATGIVNADRIGLAPLWFVGGYGLYRLSRDYWPLPFNQFVAAQEQELRSE
jgi:hypothetical protein